MERIKENMQRRYKIICNALVSLEIAIQDLNNIKDFTKVSIAPPERIYKTFRDSTIQRFEYSFDQFWKYINLYFKAHGRRIEIETPKSIFREGLKANIFTEDQCRLALKMVDHRNLTTHDYDEPLIEEISHNIPKYYDLMVTILAHIKP